MKLKKLFAVIILTALGLSIMTACGQPQSLDKIKNKGKITMYTNAAFAPYEYRNGEEIVGVDIDISKEIAKDLGVELVINDVEFSSVLTAASSGKASFCASGLSVKPERLESMDFSVTYATSVQYVILPKESSFNNIEDLKGKKMGVQTATTADFLLNDEINGTTTADGLHISGVLEGSGASVTGYDSAASAVQDIATGRMDAVVIDNLTAEMIVKSNSDLKCAELIYADGTSTTEEYAIAVNKGNTELLNEINKTIERLKKEGKIEEFVLAHTMK